MKRAYLLLITGIEVLYGSTVKCQVYYPLVETNKVWNISYFYATPPSTMKYIKFEGDSIVGPNSYKVVLQTADSNSFAWSQSGLIREAADHKVYYLGAFGFTEHLIYDFTMNLQDTTYLWGQTFPFIADTVDSVQVVTGEFRKRIVISTPAFPGYDHWIEGIGSLYGVIYSVENIFVGETDRLVCMSKNDTLIYHNPVASTCDSPIQGIPGESSGSFTIYPDPVQSSFTLELSPRELNQKKPVNIFIFNSIGEEMRTLQVDHNKAEINITDFPSGLYFIKLFAGEITGSAKFVKE